MKNLKDYLGKKVAIACRTDVEAKFVNDFLANNGGRSLYGYWEYRKNYSKEYHNCLEFSLDSLPYNCYSHEGFFEKQGYTLYKASEFMESNTSLVGRYVKALVDKPSSIRFCKKGDCYLIEEDDTNILCIKNVITQSGDWLISKKLIGVEWELMPIGFNPNQLEEPFAIQLNSQEELDAIMSFYKEKGYKMFGSSDYYCKGFVVYIKPKNKTWQTIVNKNNYPFKTLSEIGITVNTKKDTNPEFIVGKWYDFDNPDYVGKSYAKFLKLSKDDEYEYFHFSEYIGNKKYEKFKGDWFSSNCTKKLTDLSEIQEFLPLGHPDKIINSPIQESDNFVLPEKWFVCPKNEENLKLVKNHFNNFYDYKITYKDNAYTYDGIYHTHASDTRDCVEITFEQFKKYVLGKSEVMEKSWTEVSLDMMQKSLTTSYPLTPDECYTSKNLLNPEIIPIKVRNLPKFETPTRVKTVIIEPELLKI